MKCSPTEAELRRLPLRGILALSIRAARRIAFIFDGFPNQEALHEVLRLSTLLTEKEPFESKPIELQMSLFSAITRSTEQQMALPSLDALKAAVAASRAGSAATCVIDAVADRTMDVDDAEFSAQFAAKDAAAVLAVCRRYSNALAGGQAAATDYNRLGEYYGQLEPNHLELGRPIDLSEKGLLGPLWPLNSQID